MMRSVFLGFALLILAGCGGNDAKQRLVAEQKACPASIVKIAADNQRFLQNEVVLGETSGTVLRKRKGLYRMATLQRGSDVMSVPFYITGLRTCGWMSKWESLTPVVVKDDVIVAYGSEMVRDLTAQGWKLKEATWPWQRYDFGYLPKK